MVKLRVFIFASTAAVLLTMLAAAGCGSGSSEQTSAPDNLVQSPVGMPDSGQPAQLLRAISMQDADRLCFGADLVAELPNQRVSTQGTQAILFPNWSTATELSCKDLAYATYAFALDGYSGPAEVTFNWETPPTDLSTCFIGLGDQLADRWDWLGGEAFAGNTLVLDSLDPYLAGDGRLLMIVMLASTDVCTLSWLCWGDSVPPLAALTADVTGGTPPLEVFFNATGSTDVDGTIENYEWDFDGDGEYSEPGEEAWAVGGPNAIATYTEVGTYSAAVKVTDDDGAWSTATVEITVSPTNWQIITVDDVPDIGNAVSLAVIDGCPAISYIANGSQLYVRSTTPGGTNEDDWRMPVVVDSAGDVGDFTSLTVINGNPAVSYSKGLQGIWYARSATPGGDATADWSALCCFSVEAYDSSLAEVEGCPAVGIYVPDSLWYARADTATGASPDDWDHAVKVKDFG